MGVMAIDIVITAAGDLPIYQQIADQIKGAILRGELAADQPLPSIRLLAKELAISVITTKRAYEELEREGLIYTLPGKGSFVAGQSEYKLRESKEQAVEEKLREALETAARLGLSTAELLTILNRLLEGEKWDRS